MSDLSPVSAAALLGPSLISRSAAVSPAATAGLGVGGVAGGGLGLLGGSSVIVELSVVGQLLSTVSTFSAGFAALRPGAAESGLGRNFGTDLPSFSAEVQNFVDTFNHLQNTLGSVAGAAGGTGLSLGVSLASALDDAAQAAFAAENASLDQLSELGIVFTPAPAGFVGGSLTVDQQTLQAAFTSDPEGSFALLDRATSAFADLTAGFVTQAGDVSASIDRLVELAVTTQALGLFGNGLAGSGGLGGLPGLLLLDSLSRGNSSSTSNFAALSQFMLVSSLLE